MNIKSILHTENGIIELNDEVADYMKRQKDEILDLRAERDALKLKVFELEYKLNQGWLYRLLKN